MTRPSLEWAHVQPTKPYIAIASLQDVFANITAPNSC